MTEPEPEPTNVIPFVTAAQHAAELVEAARVDELLAYLADLTTGVLEGRVRGLAAVVLCDPQHPDLVLTLGEAITPSAAVLIEGLRGRVLGELLG